MSAAVIDMLDVLRRQLAAQKTATAASSRILMRAIEPPATRAAPKRVETIEVRRATVVQLVRPVDA